MCCLIETDPRHQAMPRKRQLLAWCKALPPFDVVMLPIRVDQRSAREATLTFRVGS